MKNKVKRVRRKDVSGVEAHFSEKIKATSASISVVCRYNPVCASRVSQNVKESSRVK